MKNKNPYTISFRVKLTIAEGPPTERKVQEMKTAVSGALVQEMKGVSQILVEQTNPCVQSIGR